MYVEKQYGAMTISISIIIILRRKTWQINDNNCQTLTITIRDIESQDLINEIWQ